MVGTLFFLEGNPTSNYVILGHVDVNVLCFYTSTCHIPPVATGRRMRCCFPAFLVSCSSRSSTPRKGKMHDITVHQQ